MQPTLYIGKRQMFDLIDVFSYFLNSENTCGIKVDFVTCFVCKYVVDVRDTALFFSISNAFCRATMKIVINYINLIRVL